MSFLYALWCHPFRWFPTLAEYLLWYPTPSDHDPSLVLRYFRFPFDYPSPPIRRLLEQWWPKCPPMLLALNLLVPKIQTGVFYLIVIYVWNSKTISQLNFERRLITDFFSNGFSEITLAYWTKKFDIMVSKTMIRSASMIIIIIHFLTLQSLLRQEWKLTKRVEQSVSMSPWHHYRVTRCKEKK